MPHSYDLSITAWLWLCSTYFHFHSQANETALSQDNASFVAEGKEKVADHTMALQAFAQK